MTINNLFKNRIFIASIQFFTLIFFVLLIYGSIAVSTNDKDFAKILRNTNFANLIVWSYWWPMIIATAIIFGRFWCSICPMEMVTSFFGKIGLKRKPGQFLKSGWIITLFYAIILILGIHTLAIHRIPQYMAIYMLILFAIAAFTGFIWEKRTFCTYVCPIGHLLGLYSLLSVKKLRVIDKNVCNSCKTKDCISKSNHYKFVGRSCTSELYPAEIKDNRNCILCGQCHKSCTKDNIVIKTRKIAADLFTDIKLSWAEIAFFIILTGFVLYEILSEWSVSKNVLMALPNWTNNTFGIDGDARGTIKALILFIILPAFYYMVFALLKKVFAQESLKKSFTQLVLAILPITASLHLLKAILKTTSRIPYWDYVFADIIGIETAQKIIDNPEYLNKSIPNSISPVIDIVAILLPIAGIFISLLIINKQKFNNIWSKLASIIAILIYASLFIITIIAWRWF